MNTTGLKRKINDCKWHKKGVKSRIVKFLIQNTPELENWHRKTVHSCRIELNRQLYKELKNGVKLCSVERDMINKEWKTIMEKHGFTLNNHWRSFAYQVVSPYKSYQLRHKNTIPPRPINLKEYGSIRFDDGSGVIQDLTPAAKRQGIMKITKSGKGKNKQFIEVPYYIPAYCANWKSLITKSFAGNLRPIFKKNKLQYEYGARALIEFDWSYIPKKILAFDIAKREKDYLIFNTGEIWKRTPELNEMIEQLNNINKNIDNKDKGGDLNHSDRQQHRYYWQDLQDKESLLIKTQYISHIINFAKKHKCLICVDDVTTGGTNGEYGQKIARLLKHECEQQAIPFVMVPTYHTSSRCFECGHIHESTVKAKKLWRPEIDQFVCQNCGHETHCDKMAAKNIAIFGWNIWLYEEKVRKDKDGNVLDVGLAYRRRNNCLDEIPDTMLDYTTSDLVCEA